MELGERHGPARETTIASSICQPVGFSFGLGTRASHPENPFLDRYHVRAGLALCEVRRLVESSFESSLVRSTPVKGYLYLEPGTPTKI